MTATILPLRENPWKASRDALDLSADVACHGIDIKAAGSHLMDNPRDVEAIRAGRAAALAALAKFDALEALTR